MNDGNKCNFRDDLVSRWFRGGIHSLRRRNDKRSFTLYAV